jgi:hypothetical protein
MESRTSAELRPRHNTVSSPITFKSRLFLAGVFIILLALALPLRAQISRGGEPLSLRNSMPAAVETITMPPVDVAALLAEDSAASKEEPFRFGYPFQVDYSLDNSGTWTELPNGDMLWRLRIVSPGAYSINLIYGYYDVPEGARLFVYNERKGSERTVLGAFTSVNNKTDKMFATAPVPGDRIVLEYYEPADAPFPGKISIGTIVHAYRDLFNWDVAKEALGFGSSGSCNNNVNCPEGEPWQKEKRAVAMIITSGGSRLCSGSLVNNVRQDQTPYFLTANHCLGTPSTWIFMFNYESPSCANVDGPTYMTTQGSTLLAHYSTSDFALLELSEPPPDSYQVCFAGWSAIDEESDSAVCIHHPRGDIKKISFDYDTYTSADYLETTGTTHWRIGSWDDGTTEPGSSGSPLFNKYHQVIGQLHGGYASCTSLTSDWFGKFPLSWTGGGTPQTRLSDWLDPDNTGTLALDGFDPYGGVTITHTPLPDTKDTVNAYEVVCTITSGTALIPDSLLLRYKALFETSWHTETLTATGQPNEYHGFIPPEPPGSIISYYLYARNESGAADTTDTYSFRVIKYDVAITPELLSGTGAALDTVWYDLTVTSHGVYTDSFALAVSDNVWATKLWDETRTYEIDRTGPLAPEANFSLKVSVEVPATDYGDSDSVSVKVSSLNSPMVSDTAKIHTVSAGEPLAFPFFDDFASVIPDSSKWAVISGVEINSLGIGEPSEPYSVDLNGDPSGRDTLTSQAIDLSKVSGVMLSFYYERTGGGDSPETGDDLYVEYINSSSQWQLVSQILGSGADMTAYGLIEFAIPANGYHAGFRVRFRSAVSTGNVDDWFIDDVRVDYAPNIVTTPASFSLDMIKGDSISQSLVVANSGAGTLSYTIVIDPDTGLQWISVLPTSGELLGNEADTLAVEISSALLDSGMHAAAIKVYSNDPDPGDSPATIPVELHVDPVPPAYVCGDADGNVIVNVSDAVYLIGYIFGSGSAPDPVEAGDADCNGVVNISDVTYLIAYIFGSGSPPCSDCP